MADVRKFRQQDMNQIIRIWLDASILAHSFISREYWESKATDMRNLYIPNSDTYVYENNGIAKGFIALHESTIAAVFVSPDSQQQGIGLELINKAKSLFSFLKLTVYKENTNGIRFYEKCGFRIVKEQIDDHTGHSELVMHFP
ncbi:MAG: N-acetyltransferase [Desulfovibrionaceae bacterium]